MRDVNRFDNFEKRYSDYRKNPENFTLLLARPNQSLLDHIKNMLIECISYFNYFPKFPGLSGKILVFSTIISIIFHDLGKLLPLFQYRMLNLKNGKNNSEIPAEKKYLSYHTDVSAVFAMIFQKEFFLRFDLNFWLDSKDNENSTKELYDMVSYIVINSIYNHHSKVPRSDYESDREKFYETLQQLTFQINETDYISGFFNELGVFLSNNHDLKTLFERYEITKNTDNKTTNFIFELETIFTKILSKIEALNEEISKPTNLDDLDLDDEGLNDLIMDCMLNGDISKENKLDERSINGELETGRKNAKIYNLYKKLHEIFNIKDNISKDLSGRFNNLLTNSDFYIILLFVSSLLCDLDIWDARFLNSDKKSSNLHDLPFHNYNSAEVTIAEKDRFFSKVKSYVSPPFGKIDSNSLQIDSSDNVLVENDSEENILLDNDIEVRKKPIKMLRNFLFEEVNVHNPEFGTSYILNSPTGAGKTLTLLNFSENMKKVSYENYHSIDESPFIPRVLYALPFVSIGTQVAQQIADVYSPGKEIQNSNLICVDNYLTNNFWEFSEHNNDDGIYKISEKDAKWLISSWRSDYIVTTFVKLFNSILKPYKNNFLRLHRLGYTIILLDEVQCIPVGYWNIIKEVVLSLSKILRCCIVLSTATMPKILPENSAVNISANHLSKVIKINKESKTLNQTMNRYEIRFIQNARYKITDFQIALSTFLKSIPESDVLVVLNTKSAVFQTKMFLECNLNKNKNEIMLLSTNILPLERKEKIELIKTHLKDKNSEQNCSIYDTKKNNDGGLKHKRLVVITTQLIEAGVDISFPYVFRDFSPLDSIVQTAGRCNRSFEYPKGIMYVISLFNEIDDGGKSYYSQVYKDPISFSETNKIFSKKTEVKEDPIFEKYISLSECEIRNNFSKYYDSVSVRKNTNELFEEYSLFKFDILAQDFSLIQKDYVSVPLLILNSNEAISLHQIIQKTGKLSNRFYLHSLQISKKDQKILEGQDKIVPVYSNGNILYYYVPEDKVSQCYSKEFGLFIEVP